VKSDLVKSFWTWGPLHITTPSICNVPHVGDSKVEATSLDSAPSPSLGGGRWGCRGASAASLDANVALGDNMDEMPRRSASDSS